MKKKVLALLTAAAMMFATTGVLPETRFNYSSLISASASSYGDYDYYVLADGTIKITKYNGSDEELSIPEKINDKSVTSIKEHAFNGCDNIVSITIPDSVTNIGRYAFYDCKSLTSITIPNSVTSIGASAFMGCTELTSITIPDSITILEPGVFCCSGLTSITIPDSVTSIKQEAFSECTRLKSITIRDGVKRIGLHAFYKCTSLSSITIPDSVTNIGKSAFDNCTSLTSITIPNSDININNFAFLHCTKLKSIIIPDSVTSIGEYAFGYNYYNTENNDYVKIPNFKIYCYKDTEGEKYAIDNEFDYELIGESKAISDCTIGLSSSLYTYDGSPKEPSVTVKDGSAILTSDIDYTVSYSNNINAGTGKITITGIGKYTGYETKTFTINQKTISGTTVILDHTSYIYDGTEKKPSVVIKDDSKILTDGTDYTVSYSNNTNVGTATVTITGKGNYSDTTSKNFTITEAPKTNISYCTVTIETISYTYDGTPKQPSVTVKDSSTTLTNDIDYTVLYSNNTNAGTGIVTIIGNGKYTGSVTKDFTINEKSISDATVTLSQTSYTYDGNEKKPSVTVKDGSKALSNDTDYTISYSNNKNIGTAKVTVTGNGNYCDTITKNFTITEAPISYCTVTLETNSYTYSGTAKRPSVTVMNGSIKLTNGTDYTVSYSNNTNVGTGEVTIIGKGYYTGSVTKTFSINAKYISSTTVTLSQKSYNYDGNEKKPTVTVKDGSAVLINGTDYTVSYSNNKNVGKAKVTVTGIGNYTGNISKDFTIIETYKTDISKCTVTFETSSYTYDGTAKKPSVTVINASIKLTNGTDYTVSYSNNTNAGSGKVTITGIGKFTGSVIKTFTINAKPISSATVTLSQKSYNYDGKEKKPTVTIKDSSTILVNDKDYTFYYSNNINVGTAKVIVTGKGNYSGIRTINFTIEPKPEVSKSFEWGKDNWNFINTDANYIENHGFTGGTNRNHISTSYLNKLLNQASNKENQRIKKMLDQEWQGSCFGMTSVIILAKNGLLPYSNYTTGAKNTYSLDKPLKNSKVDSLITYYLLSQSLDYAQQKINYYYTTEYGKPNLQIKRIIAEIDKFGMANICDKNHSLLAYDYSYGSWRWNGITYNGCIYLCDPNCSDHFDEKYCLYYNTSSYNWIIPAYGTRKSSIQGDYIDFVVGDPNILNTYGYLNNNPKSSFDYYFGNLKANLVAENHNISKMKKSENGYVKTATNEDDIISCMRPNMINGDDEEVLNYILRDTESAYVLSQSDPKPLDLSIDYENCLLEAASKAGKSIIFDNNGYVEVNGESADYAISMTYNELYPTDWFTVEVNGQNANQASLKMVNNGWIISANHLENVVINANNKEVEVTTSFSTDYQSAFIYEINEYTIGIAVDTDNNGTYETTLDTQSKDLISSAMITTDSYKYVFDDKIVEPLVTVKIGDKILIQDEDYTVEYINNDKIGEGKIVIRGIGHYSGTTILGFEIIAKDNSILGDVNGDGKITVTDIAKVAAHVKGKKSLSSEYQKSADVNGDGMITVTDISKIAAHVKGKKSLS